MHLFHSTLQVPRPAGQSGDIDSLAARALDSFLAAEATHAPAAPAWHAALVRAHVDHCCWGLEHTVRAPAEGLVKLCRELAAFGDGPDGAFAALRGTIASALA